jgi:superfamily II DNA or RNA helicase
MFVGSCTRLSMRMPRDHPTQPCYRCFTFLVGQRLPRRHVFSGSFSVADERMPKPFYHPSRPPVVVRFRSLTDLLRWPPLLNLPFMFQLLPMPSASLPQPGQLVHVRHRPFVVRDVRASALPARGSAEKQNLVTLSSLEDEGLGEEMTVLWELEPGAVCHEESGLPTPKAFDEPRRLEAFLDAVRWGAVSQADETALQSPFRSGIEVDEYQLDPVVRALSMPRVNLLIADDVGLGKTVETGLVAQELILRHRVRTVLVVCPSSLQVQWRDEMRDKFGLDFRIVDTELMRDLRRRRGLHVNPWSHFPRLITSVDFLKRERPLRLFRECLPSNGESTYPRRFDLLVVDEAHNVAPSGRGKYATDSQRTAAIRTLAPHFEHRLFLSATPHNGYRESFSALLELLDNQRFARNVMPNRGQLEAVMVRRMKSELKTRWDGSRRFADRKVFPIEVDYTPAERRAHQALRLYAEARQASAVADGECFATEFVMKLLKKRLFSSPAAFATTLEKHIKTVGLGSGSEAHAWRKQLENADEDNANDDDYETTTLEAVETASKVARPLSTEEKKLLGELREYASTASSAADSKARALIKWVTEIVRPNGKWTNERVIIFTEYRTTQKWLHGLLAAAGLAADKRLLMIYGGMDHEEREAAKAAFQADPEIAPVRILLATDAASEGINLQNHCHILIHTEIPWNPNRLEQRNGRVDRHGQKAETVEIFHFVGKGFNEVTPTAAPGELEGDLEFLMRAALKVEAIREDLGKVGPVIAEQVEEAMLGKRKTLDTTRAERDSEPVRKMLKFERKLEEQLERMAKQLHETKRELHLTPDAIKNVVEVGLALAGQPPLKEARVKGLWPDAKRKACPVFTVPVMSGSWALCAQGLEHPHTKEIRPIVFDPNDGRDRDDVVLAHLNHRLVQMCLRLLRAEIWSHGGSRKLNRVAVRIVPDSALESPAVIAHGRLVVLGGDNHRLHEEVIIAGGFIKEGRFTRMNVGETKAAYDAATDERSPEAVENRLLQLWPRLETALMAALEGRRDDRTKNLKGFLDARAEKEVANMSSVLNELKTAIEAELNTKIDPQAEFSFVEKEQFQRDLGSLRKRLADIPVEIEREAKHLRERFRDPKPRLFPVAVTFLIPPRAVRSITH